MNIIPTPQSITVEHQTMVSWPEFKSRELSGLPTETIELLRHDFPGPLQSAKAPGFRARMMKPNAPDLTPAQVPAQPDAYVLRVTVDGVAIDASSRAGLWYGLQTLAQMTRDTDTIPVCEIRDHAAIRRRGIHWDLKG
ncbi:MAG: hypothetical protein KAG97_12175, partial [Victivallales bacterium]|nr:hypothetical protein [Victivallales bacterium]